MNRSKSSLQILPYHGARAHNRSLACVRRRQCIICELREGWRVSRDSTGGVAGRKGMWTEEMQLPAMLGQALRKASRVQQRSSVPDSDAALHAKP